MNNNVILYPNIIFFKYNNHEGEDMEQIFARKIKEFFDTHECWWGHNNKNITPKKIQNYVKENDKKVYIFFCRSDKESSVNEENNIPNIKYTINEKHSKHEELYIDLPKGIHINNCKYALITTGLKAVNFKVDISQYTPIFDSSSYNSITDFYQTNTFKMGVLAEYKENKNVDTDLRQVDYIAELKYPYSVYIK